MALSRRLFPTYPGRAAFGENIKVQNAGDYLQKKRLKNSYCNISICKPLNNIKTQGQLLELKKVNYFYNNCNSYNFNKYNLNVNLFTKINLKNVRSVLHRPVDLTGLQNSLVLGELRNILLNNASTPSTSGTAINSEYSSSIDNNALIPPYINYIIDPDSELFGDSTCGINNYENYIVYNPPYGTINTGQDINTLVPTPPIDLTAEHGDRSATISFTQTSDGGNSIINYKYSLDGGSTFFSFILPQISSPVTIDGLTNGTDYTIRLKAVSKNGDSLSSLPVIVRPSTIPDAPIIISATAGDGKATIRLDDTTSTGGSPITNYSYSIDGGFSFSTFDPPQELAPITNTVTIYGLTNGTTYAVELKAININGTSAASVNPPTLVTPTL